MSVDGTCIMHITIQHVQNGGGGEEEEVEVVKEELWKSS
jgi:hypothetical protein